MRWGLWNYKLEAWVSDEDGKPFESDSLADTVTKLQHMDEVQKLHIHIEPIPDHEW